jgi:hypothetical protein
LRILLILTVIFNFLIAETSSEKTDINLTEDIQKMEELEAQNSNFIDYEKWHEYTGLATLGLVALTVATIKEEELHEAFGMASAVGMGVTSTLGLMAYKDDMFDLSEGFTADHWHALLGTLATIAIVASASTAPEHAHAPLGMAGGILATASFIIVKW